jgi:hypothetical protein
MALKTIRRHFRNVCLSIPFSVALSGIAVLAYQSTTWVRLGYWQSLGSRSVLYRILPSDFLRWLHNPKSWLGLKKIVFSVFDLPLALFLLLFGLVVFLLIIIAFDLFLTPDKTEPINGRRWRCI